jgi:hypothetical protein
METGGDLGGDWFYLELKNLCDRREDGLASMISLFSVLLGQPARPLGEDGDPAGLDAIWR